MTVGRKNIPYLDTFRAIATFGVIVIHVATPALKMNFGKNDEYWWVANVVDSAVRFAVPLFLMLTGATMLPRNNYPLKGFYKKRLMRVLLPFMFWMVVYWVFRWAELRSSQQPHDIAGIIRWAGQLFVNEGISKHFWYFYMILVVYLFVPFLGRVLGRLSMNAVLSFLIIWVVVSFLLRNVPMNMYGWSVDALPSKLLGWVLHSGYLVLGYFLVQYIPVTSRTRWIWGTLFVGSIVSSSVLTYFFSQASRSLDLSMYGYLKPNTMLQSVAFFLLLKDTELKNKSLLFIQQLVCNYSYGIYLAHVMVLGILFDHGFYWRIAHPVVSLPLVSLVTFLLCFALVFFIRKIPFGKYISG